MPSTKRKQGAAATAESGGCEEVLLEDGGYKRRRIGAKHWQYMRELQFWLWFGFRLWFGFWFWLWFLTKEPAWLQF